MSDQLDWADLMAFAVWCSAVNSTPEAQLKYCYPPMLDANVGRIATYIRQAYREGHSDGHAAGCRDGSRAEILRFTGRDIR